MAIIRVLRTVRDDLTSYGGYPYPKWTEETGPVKVSCEDWNPNPECGNGLHGITKENYKYAVYNQYRYSRIKWMVIEVDDNPDNFVKITNKVKFKEGNIIYQGNDVEKAIRMVFDDAESLDALLQDHIYCLHFRDRTKNTLLRDMSSIFYLFKSKVDFIDYELCEFAISQSPHLIEIVLDYRPDLVDYNLCKLASSSGLFLSGVVLKHRPDLFDYDLSNISVRKYRGSIENILKYRPDLVDYDLCQLAVNQSKYALDHILKYKVELVTDELRELHKKLWQ